jgi:hypothetical protein
VFKTKEIKNKGPHQQNEKWGLDTNLWISIFCTSKHSGRIYMPIYVYRYSLGSNFYKWSRTLFFIVMFFLFSFSHCSYKVRLSLRVTGVTPDALGYLLLLFFSQQFLKGNEQYRKLLLASYILLFPLWLFGPTSSHVLTTSVGVSKQ